MSKILAIDDKRDNLVALSALLNNLMPGCAVITAQSGMEGIEKAKAELPDAILLDVKMPGIDGFQTCRRLKSDASTKHIPVIMITAIKTDPQSRIKGLEIGADAFLAKPIDQYELVSQVNVALRIKKAEDALREERDSLERLVKVRTAALKEREDHFRSLVESTSDWIWAIDAEGRYCYASPQVADFLGYKPNEVIGKTPFDFMPHQEAERVKGIFQEISDSRRPFKGLENINIRKNGEPIVLETSGIPIFDAAGKFGGYRGIDRDITERKRAEEALRESEGKLRAVFDATPFPIAVVDLQDDNIRFWSRSALTLFGHTAPTTSEWYQIAYPDPDYRREVIKKWKPFLEIAHESRHVSVNTGEYKVSCYDGSVRICELYATFLTDSLMVTFNDITQRKRMEEDLRNSEERLRTVFEAAKNVSFIITDAQDPEPIVQEFSPGAERIFGFSKTEMVGNPISILHLPNDIAKFPEAHKQMREGKTGFSGETILVRKSGERFPALFSTYPLFDKNGDMSASLGVSIDISEQKKLESQLLQSQKMESIGTLAGGIAHDFNNILSSVIGYTELALDEVEKGTHIEDNLQEVYTAGKRAKDLVRQILTFARQSDEEIKPVQVATIGNEVLKLIRSSVPTSIEIRQHIESDSLIMGNITQVHQILMNLFTNAAHAMEDGGGILDFSLKDVVMDSGGNRKKLDLKPGNYIEIKVSDTGVGIAPEIIGSVFDPFFTTKGPGEGTGMGLATVHGIVESYGGKISVDSKPGQGTLFAIYLPITKNRQEHRPYQSELLPKGKERILFVDDEASIAKMGGQALERLGYTVSIRTSSLDALELFRSKPKDFDLVITDMAMPNMTGGKLAGELIKIRPDIPVILCTGYSKTISDELAAQIGIKAFAYKPVAKVDLAKTVRKVLDDQPQEQTTGRILLIDDESEIRKLFIQKLAGRGYEIIEACDGKEGLKLYHENRPDLVITDLVMPEKEGIETITELKREFPDVKIIAISGGGRNAPDAYLHIAKNLGADRTFPKPIDWPELINTVRELLK